MEMKMLIAFGISLLVTMIVLPKFFIPYLHKLKFGQVQREEGLASHKKKQGTPTMGGIVFVLVPLLVCLVLHPQMFSDTRVLVVVLAYVGYACIGLIDDALIVVKKSNDGLKPIVKLLLQLILASVFYFMYESVSSTDIWIPIIDVSIDLGYFYFFFIIVMFLGESNAVNFSDGVDGLCAGLMVIALAPFVLFTYMSGSQDLTLLLVCVIGSLLGYLRYNTYPAKIFMGDTGSLALGGLFAAIAMIEKKELLILIIGGVFLIEMLSVVIQVLVFKKTRRRVFLMAPLHHHYERKGLRETQVVLKFYSWGFILAIIGFIIGVI